MHKVWILKNCKGLLEYVDSRSLKNNIQIVNFSTLYTTIPGGNLNTRLNEIFHNSFYFTNGKLRYKFMALFLA